MQQAIQYTRCPHCETAFKVSTDILAVAKGKVRCGACLVVFQATDYLLKPAAKNESRPVSENAETKQPEIEQAEAELPVSDSSQPDNELAEASAINQAPAEQAPVEHKLAEQEPAEQEPVEQEPVEQEAVVQELVEQEPVDDLAVAGDLPFEDHASAEDEPAIQDEILDNAEVSDAAIDDIAHGIADGAAEADVDVDVDVDSFELEREVNIDDELGADLNGELDAEADLDSELKLDEAPESGETPEAETADSEMPEPEMPEPENPDPQTTEFDASQEVNIDDPISFSIDPDNLDAADEQLSLIPESPQDLMEFNRCAETEIELTDSDDPPISFEDDGLEQPFDDQPSDSSHPDNVLDELEFNHSDFEPADLECLDLPDNSETVTETGSDADSDTSANTDTENETAIGHELDSTAEAEHESLNDPLDNLDTSELDQDMLELLEDAQALATNDSASEAISETDSAAQQAIGAGITDEQVDKNDELPQQDFEQLADNLTQQINDADTVPDPLDEFEHRVEEKNNTIRNALVLMVILSLLGLGGFQFWQSRQQLAWDESWGEMTTSVCRLLPCDLKPRRNIAQIQLLQRSVAPSELNDNRLEIKMVLANQADFAQPYPLIKINFSNSHGESVAIQKIAATQYLPQKADQLMPAGTEVELQFETELPHADAMGFEFSFE